MSALYASASQPPGLVVVFASGSVAVTTGDPLVLPEESTQTAPYDNPCIVKTFAFRRTPCAFVPVDDAMVLVTALHHEGSGHELRLNVTVLRDDGTVNREACKDISVSGIDGSVSWRMEYLAAVTQACCH